MPSAQAASPSLTTRRESLPLADLSMALREVQRATEPAQAEAALVTREIVFTTGAAVRRYDWVRDRFYREELVVEPGAIRLDRLERGAPLLNSHNAWTLEYQIGVVDAPAIEGGSGTCRATFSRRPSAAGYVQDVLDGIVRNVSVGYVRHRMEMIAPAEENGQWVYRVTDWEPHEVSLVPIPADAGAQVRAAGEPPPAGQEWAARTFPCLITEIPAVTQGRSMPSTHITDTTANPSDPVQTATRAEPTPAAPAATPQDAPAGETAAQAAERAATITTLCVRHGMAERAAGFITGGQTVDQVRGAILDHMFDADQRSGNRGPNITTVRDEMQTRMAGLVQAIEHRMAPTTTLDDSGRAWRGMSLLEMGREFLHAHDQSTRGMDRMELAARMLHFRAGNGAMGTTDFPQLFANVANKRLRAAYTENPGTYERWARRAPNLTDFKKIQVTALSAAPDLLKTNEHGEFKYGSFSEGAETYQAFTYGRIVTFTRQAIVNDDLRAFDRIVGAFGAAARRLENRLVYALLTGNTTLAADNTALFHANHANLATGAGSALSITSLTTGRTSMRLQKGMAGEELNIAPSMIIVPAAMEQAAYQLTSANYVPAKQADTNEFRSGGRTALEPIVEPLLDAVSATTWYMCSSTGMIDTIEYAFFDGAAGPVIDTEIGFEIDGVSYKCREDFACAAIDYRGLYKAVGA